MNFSQNQTQTQRTKRRGRSCVESASETGFNPRAAAVTSWLCLERSGSSDERRLAASEAHNMRRACANQQGRPFGAWYNRWYCSAGHERTTREQTLYYELYPKMPPTCSFVFPARFERAPHSHGVCVRACVCVCECGPRNAGRPPLPHFRPRNRRQSPGRQDTR